jgi:hypothetical protein
MIMANEQKDILFQRWTSGGLPVDLDNSTPLHLSLNKRWSGGVPTPRGKQEMKANIETINGKVTLKVFYNPATCDWDEAIKAGLASYGLKEGKVKVIAAPETPNIQGVLFER